jgi:uncharacterized protein with ATP-grasp and redox domains
MKCEMDCVACLVKQALGAARFVTDNEELHEALVERVMELAAAADMRQSPPAIAQQIHRVVREMTGVADPYAQVKRRFNRFAMDLYPKLYRRIAQSADPADTALRYAIAGNTIDFGVGVELSEADVDQAIDDAMHLPLYGTIDRFWQAVEQAHDILYLADNAGEIVFDRLLIERMPMRRLTVAVRGRPIINDATMEDAEAVGLTNVVEVIDNGSDAPGTILHDCSERFRQRFDEAELVISKGQGNYETLGDEPKHIYFILKTKCKMVAHDLAREIGDHVVMAGQHHDCD